MVGQSVELGRRGDVEGLVHAVHAQGDVEGILHVVVVDRERHSVVQSSKIPQKLQQIIFLLNLVDKYPLDKVPTILKRPIIAKIVAAVQSSIPLSLT